MSPLSEVNNRTPRKQPKDVVEPDFFIVGAPRCGTTALSSYLADHPQICFSKPKEPHFFCTDMPAMRYVTEDKDYLACFEHGSHEMTRAAGEGSVWYLYSPAAISNVLCRYPHAKFIIMVRNPLDLIPSFHQKAIESLDEEVRDFETAWHLQSTRRNGLKIPARCRDKKLLDYVWVGRLGVQVQRMFQQVDTAKRRVIVYDDFVSDPLRVYVSVLEFLGIEYDSREDFPPVNANRRIRNLSLHAFARNPPASMVKLVEIAKRIFGFNRLGLLPSLRRKLMVETARPPQSEKLRASMLAEFSADIDLLGALIQRDLSHWKRQETIVNIETENLSGIGKKPRILFVLSGLGAGGAERVACNMLNFWASQQFQVGLLTLANLEDDHYSVDTRVSRLSLDIIWTSQNILVGLISNLKRMRMIRSSVVEFAPDIVISFIDRTNILVIASLLGTKLPVIVSERVDPREHSIDPVRRLARRCLYPFARALVVQTESVAAWGRSVTRSNKVEVIVNPIDVLPEPSVYANRPQVAVAVGRLAHQKGFDLLIRAFAVSRMRVAGWKLNILGEGPERPALQQLIDKHDLTNQVSLAGVVSEPWKWLDQARVFVLPSRFEGFPNALLEAMSMGCASIAADCPSGPGEIISNGENGMLVQPEDVDALVLALDSLEQNQLLAETLSDRGRMVRDRFATRKIMSEWNELIRNKLEKQCKTIWRHQDKKQRVENDLSLAPIGHDS